jgi:hypothetical protein
MAVKGAGVIATLEGATRIILMGSQKVVKKKLIFIKDCTNKRPIWSMAKLHNKRVVCDNKVIRVYIVAAYPIQYPL